MLGIHLFNWVIRLLNQRTETRADELQMRRELLAHQRRQLIHQHIPDLYTAQDTFGPRFDELLALLTAHDPAGIGTTHPYYSELTRTVLYQLDKARSDEQLLRLLHQEQGLWFGSGSIVEGCLTALVPTIRQWQAETSL